MKSVRGAAEMKQMRIRVSVWVGVFAILFSVSPLAFSKIVSTKPLMEMGQKDSFQWGAYTFKRVFDDEYEIKLQV